MVMIFKSSHTPGLANAKGVHLALGTQITCRSPQGKEFTGTIDSDVERHDDAPDDGLGYEVVFDDGRFFVPWASIVWWEGKINDLATLNRLLK